MARVKARCHTNCDDSFIAWQIESRIPNLRGFAIKRRRTPPGGKQADEIVSSWVGFEGDSAAEGERRVASALVVYETSVVVFPVGPEGNAGRSPRVPQAEACGESGVP